jgi:TonB family protein
VKILLALLVAAQLSAASALAQKKTTSPVGRKATSSKAIHSQKPVTGSGIILVHVDHGTGRVTAARMFKSTGHAVLDNAAVTAFREAKFKPKTKSPLKIPISFTLTGAEL